MVDVAFVNPFIQSTLNVFKTMVFMEATMEQPYLKVQEDLGHTIDISGSIGLAGQTNGVVVIAFSQEIACKISSNMLGEDITEIDDTVKDTIGEMANMIAGGAKGIMAEKQLNFKIALPSVTVGKDHTISYPKGIPSMVIPFRLATLDSKFYVEVCLKTDNA